MPLKNPFTRRSGASAPNNENLHPSLDGKDPGFERVDTVGSKASSAHSIRSSKSQDNGEYELSGMFIFRTFLLGIVCLVMRGNED